MCGKEIEPAKTVRIRAEGIPIGERLYNTPLCASCDYDLCAECFERAVNEKTGEKTVCEISTYEHDKETSMKFVNEAEWARKRAEVLNRRPEPFDETRGGTK